MQADASENARHAQLRALPSVDELMRQPTVASLVNEFHRNELLHVVRDVLEVQRRRILSGTPAAPDLAGLALAIRQMLHRRAQPGLRRVINATGIVLHTGLGRAPLPSEALEAVAEVATGYSSLELDLESGQRGDRQAHVAALLRELTGADDALVVNNNAAATWLALNALALEREVIVSRGQLVEIGGSYRMPDIMSAAGCRMVEVGTTNRTRLADYRRALTPDTRALLHVHTSNYRIKGFVESVTVAELSQLAETLTPRVLVVDDLGSGLLDHVQTPPAAAAARDRGAPDSQDADDNEACATAEPTPGAPPAWDEPTVRESIAAGADLTLFSGDKLLGGPQAGIIVGRSDLLRAIRNSPLMRALRPDKLSLAALEATLRLYRDPGASLRIPTLRLLTMPPDQLRRQAARIEELVRQAVPSAGVESRADSSYAGGGALPTWALPTWVVALRHQGIRAADLARELRVRDVPVIGRIQGDALLLDCRTLLPGQDDEIAVAVAEVVRELLDR